MGILALTADERVTGVKFTHVAGGGYGIHWPDIDEDLSTEGLLRGAPAPRSRQIEDTDKNKSRRTKR